MIMRRLQTCFAVLLFTPFLKASSEDNSQIRPLSSAETSSDVGADKWPASVETRRTSSISSSTTKFRTSISSSCSADGAAKPAKLADSLANENDSTVSSAGGLTDSMRGTAPANTSARLPRSIRPTHYRIFLQPFINGNWTIKGKAEIELQVLESTNTITLNMADIITSNDTFQLSSAEDDGSTLPKVTKQSYDPRRQFYTALLDGDLTPGRTYLFSIEFEGFLNDKLVGFYRSMYVDDNDKKRWLAATQFSPTDARRAFPCFDEPDFKATFDIFLARRTHMTAISNMPLVASTPISGEGWVLDQFDTTPPLSTYIVGFTICDFAFLQTNDLNHTNFKVWSRRSALDQAKYAAVIAPGILTFLEDYFRLPFPLPKLDMAAIPDFKFRGMENWGLIMYRESAMLYDKEISTVSDKSNVGNVIAHEIAHQWFGNLVTPQWWSDLWLKEGFASFMGYVGLDAVEPTWQVLDLFITDYMQPAFALDGLQSSHPINVVVDNPDEIGEIFDAISYKKGATIIKMMQHFLTEATFRKGLTNYLQALKYSNAKQDDLWQHLTEAAMEDETLPSRLSVKEIMDTWTLQMGYPVVTVIRNSTGAKITQEWFLLDGSGDAKSAKNEYSRYKWWVPISYTSQSEANFADTSPKVWMNNSESEINLEELPTSDGWIILNIQRCGFYRVNYDKSMWQQLGKQLKSNSTLIHAVNRAQLVDDAMNLARAGRLEYSIALELSSYLELEREYVPWKAAISSYNYLLLMLERTPKYGALRKYFLKLLVPLYNYVGFEDNLQDPYLEQMKRTEMVRAACKLQHDSCVRNATSLFRLWLLSSPGESIISPNVKWPVLCNGIASTGEKEWEAAWMTYLSSNVGAEKESILSALGCSREVWILSRYLDMAFSPSRGVRKQDSSQVFQSVATNVAGRHLAWNYLRDNWNYTVKYLGYGSTHLSRLIQSATKGFNTARDVRELEEFKKQNEGNLGSAVRAVDQALERSQLNVAWMDSHFDAVVQWLQDKGYSSAVANSESKTPNQK